MRHQGAKTCAPGSDKTARAWAPGSRKLFKAGATAAMALLVALAFDPVTALADEQPRSQAGSRSAGDTRPSASRPSSPPSSPRSSSPAATPSRPSSPSQPAARGAERRSEGSTRIPDDRRGDGRAQAERRHRATPTPWNTGFYPYGYYSPWWYGGGFWNSLWWWDWYEPFAYGHYGHYGSYGPYGHYGRSGRYGHYGSGRRGGGYDFGALDLDVSPAKTEVWLDGEYIGRVDAFDGFPQYLWLEEGTYDLVLFRDGYQTISRQITVRPGVVQQIDHELERGESTRPEALVSKSHEVRDRRLRYESEAQERAREWGDEDDDAEDAEAEDADTEEAEAAVAEEMAAETAEDIPVGDEDSGRRDARAEPGRVLLDIQPADASVYLDGRFLGTGSDLARLHSGLLVDRGSHRLAIVRPGYRQREVQFVVEPGEDLELEVELEPGG
jgi:hypothetical protein